MTNRRQKKKKQFESIKRKLNKEFWRDLYKKAQQDVDYIRDLNLATSIAYHSIIATKKVFIIDDIWDEELIKAFEEEDIGLGTEGYTVTSVIEIIKEYGDVLLKSVEKGVLPKEIINLARMACEQDLKEYKKLYNEYFKL